MDLNLEEIDKITIEEGATDEQILAAIRSSFQDKVSLENKDKAAQLLYNYIYHIVEIVVEKGTNKAQLLYDCGIIFYRQCIALNLTFLSQIFNIKNNTISFLFKAWAKCIQWDVNDKRAIIHSFDPNIDLKLWTLRQPPENDPILSFSDVVNDLKAPQTITFINNIPHIAEQPYLTVDTDALYRKSMRHNVCFDDPPRKWIFDQKPKHKLVFVD
ncbi:hypothetical protein GPJ56_001577 [Histomonas meleagridis]|uniref:uncharacterized protein n=1 Tax=Histomonas meleagridis TaxID=135588 RepID=UPI003559AE6D|nr:hypothetical protein GPJ56_001577 [Histomonas meleagridis]KAH0807083.1 hypothetical protein GO595_000259 [Histomonas meleagridis]